ncbi:MAG: 4-hydroxybenzoate octaprenyltransferase [Planctomycetota bacterium]|jgi:4-hydroxybenzoate polyprenyltransferase
MMGLVASSSPIRAARVIAADIKLHHSIFAMPFAVLAAFMAAAAPSIAWSRFGGQLALVVAAMVLARTVAMLANRLLDRDIDRANPRTAARALPSGRLSVRTARWVGLGCGAGFLVVCAAFGVFYANWWPAFLGLPVLGWLSLYPLLKRFTSLSHLYLGLSLAISPLAAALAVHPPAVGEQPGLWLLAAMVLCWVTGFDIIYALQDVDADRRQRLHSLPSRVGVPRALWLSRGLHAAAAAALVAAAWLDPRFGALFAVGVLLVVTLLVYEHLTVWRWGMSRIALAFFTLNGMISCVLSALGVGDVLTGR